MSVSGSKRVQKSFKILGSKRERGIWKKEGSLRVAEAQLQWPDDHRRWERKWWWLSLTRLKMVWEEFIKRFREERCGSTWIKPAIQESSPFSMVLRPSSTLPWQLLRSNQRASCSIKQGTKSPILVLFFFFWLKLVGSPIKGLLAWFSYILSQDWVMYLGFFIFNFLNQGCWCAKLPIHFLEISYFFVDIVYSSLNSNC